MSPPTPAWPGTDSQSDNLAPTAVYVGFWVGVPFLSLLIGDWFRLVSPWRAIGRAVGWATRGGGSESFPYPERLGHWPAVAGILAFVICELCWATGREPGPLGVLMLVYLVVQLVGMGVYGVEPWTRRADGFGVWFGMFALLSPVGRRADGRVVLRPPVVAATTLRAGAGTVALLIVGVASTAFDGAAEGALFNDVRVELQDFFVSLGFSLGTGLELAFLIGLFVAIAIVGTLWWLGTEGMAHAGSGLSRRELSLRFAHTLVPIAAAYVVAHYFSLLAYNGQDLWRLASDPLGDGSDLFGGAGGRIDYSVVSATAIWYVQSGALVAGHVAALVLAHDRALRIHGSARARRLIADRHAVADGLLHPARPVAALGGAERMILFAHAGHWLVQLIYLVPLAVLVGVILAGRIRDRREAANEQVSEPGPE